MLTSLLQRFRDFLSSHSGNSMSAEDLNFIEGLQSENGPSEPQAYAVLLVELASTDQNFDKREQEIIQATLSTLFGCSKVETDNLIEQAEQILSTFRGSDTFVTKIKEQYSRQERGRILKVIDEIISADGHKDEYENHLRQKFAKLLE